MEAAGRRCALLFGLALALLAGPAGASPRQDQEPTATEDSANAGPGWGVEPGGPGDRSWFVYQLAPGQSLRDVVAVENPTDKPITFDLYPTDAFNTEDVGAWALDEPGVEPDDVGTWIEVGQNRYTVEPGRRVEIPFEITIPRDATPGDHAGAIVGANTEPEQTVTETGATVDLMRRIGARVYVRVEGPLEPALDITQLDVDIDPSPWPLSGGEATVVYRVTNTGNVRLSPDAKLSLQGLLGHEVESLSSRSLPELLPGGSVRVEVTTNVSAWPVDRVQTRLEVTATNAAVTRTTTSWSISPSMIVLAALIVGFTAWRAWRRRRRRAQPATGGPARERELVGS